MVEVQKRVDPGGVELGDGSFGAVSDLEGRHVEKHVLEPASVRHEDVLEAQDVLVARGGRSRKVEKPGDDRWVEGVLRLRVAAHRNCGVGRRRERARVAAVVRRHHERGPRRAEHDRQAEEQDGV